MSEALTVDTAYACNTIAALLHHAATWDRESPTYAQEVYVQWPEHLPKEVVLTWAEVMRKAAAELRRLHAENEALRAEVERLRLMQPVIIGPTGQSNMLTAGEIAAIDAARKEST